MKNKWNFAVFVFILFSLFLSYNNFQNREYDWDLPGYVGSLLVSENGEYTKQTHKLIYSEIKKESTQKEFNKIIGLGKDDATNYFYRSELAFQEQLPYYQIKFGYNLFVKFIYSLGFSAPQSVLLSNTIFYFLSTIVLFFIFKNLFPQNLFLVFFLSSLFVLLPPVRYLSTVASPDMMMVFLVLVFIGLLIQKKNQILIFIALLVIVISRPDYIPFAITYYLFYFFINYIRQEKQKFHEFLFPVFISLAYFFILKFYHYPGWDDVFYDSLIHRRNFISKELPVFSLNQYFHIIINNIIHFKKITFIAILLLGLTFFYNKSLEYRIISLFFFVNIYIKFLFFPLPGEFRFYLPFIIGLCIWFIHCYKNRNLKNATV